MCVKDSLSEGILVLIVCWFRVVVRTILNCFFTKCKQNGHYRDWYERAAIPYYRTLVINSVCRVAKCREFRA